MRYQFGTGTEQQEYTETIPVSCGMRYGTQAQSYGFLTEKNQFLEKRLQIPELNSGYRAVYWLQGQDEPKLAEDEHGCYVDYDGAGEMPLTFVTDVRKEGNYRVSVELFLPEEAEVLLFLGRRRLAWRGSLAAGSHQILDMPLNICQVIPRTFTEAMDDTTADVTVIGRGVRLAAVEVNAWDGRTIYIAGDSTVTDQSADYPYLPEQSYSGWGQMLSAYVGERAVSNHAHSGLTTESFRSEGHYDILLSRIGADDICLLQFGHNDQKLMHLMADGGYRENLIRYIKELRERGAVPVLVTPLARNSWRGDGSYNDLLADYAKTCIDAAKESDVPLIDLHAHSMAQITKLGRDRVKAYFFPSDYTHTNDYGAYAAAGFIAGELHRLGLLEGQVIAQGTEGIWQPHDKLRQVPVPKQYQDQENPLAEELLCPLENPNGALTRAEGFSFVIQTMHFFPTNVYNDMFADVIGHETYAGTVECAWQNGMIPEGLVEDGKIYPAREMTGEEFLKVLLLGYQSRKPLPVTGADEVQTAEYMKLLPEDFAPENVITREQAAAICRKLSI